MIELTSDIYSVLHDSGRTLCIDTSIRNGWDLPTMTKWTIWVLLRDNLFSYECTEKQIKGLKENRRYSNSKFRKIINSLNLLIQKNPAKPCCPDIRYMAKHFFLLYILSTPELLDWLKGKE